MPFITHLGSGGLLWLVVAAVMLVRKETRATGIVMILAIALSGIFTNLIIKPLFNRPRPFQSYPVEILIGPPLGSSFPSGHTTASFAGAVAYAIMRRDKLRWALLFMAVLISFSRLYLFVHYPSDVLVGMIIGILFAFLAKKLYGYGAERLGCDHD